MKTNSTLGCLSRARPDDFAGLIWSMDQMFPTHSVDEMLKCSQLYA